MFTPKQSNPIMLEDETVHTGTQKSRVHCSLPWKKSLLLWAFGQREVACEVSGVTLHCPSHLADGARPRRSATVASVGSGGHRPIPPAARLSSSCGRLRSAMWKVWVGKRCEMEAKRKRRCSDDQSPGEHSVCLDRRL